MPLPWRDVNAAHPREVASLLDLTPARERGKYGCPGCDSSDGLHAYGPGGGFYCWAGCARKYSAVDLAGVVWGLAPADACQRLAGLLGIACDPATSPYSGPAPVRAARRPVAASVDPLEALWSLPGAQLPPAVFSVVLDALTLTDRGAEYLRGRGFDADAARAYGFRGLDGREDWYRLRCAVADAGFRTQERRAAGCDIQQLPPSPDWKAAEPAALVIPYAFQGATVGLRFRALDGTAPKLVGLAGYRLPVPFNVDAADGADVLHVVEGELNAYAVHATGGASWGLPGAGGWRAEWAARVAHVRSVVAWFDNDAAGDKGAARLAESLAAELGTDWVTERCRRVRLPAGTDANDLHREGGLRAYLDQLAA